MKVSGRNVKVREHVYTVKGTGVLLQDHRTRQYAVTLRAEGPDRAELYVVLDPEEMARLVESYEKCKRWNGGDFSHD